MVKSVKKGLNQTAEDKIKSWLEAPYDDETRSEVRALMKNHPEELEEAFTTELQFGTAGLRAKMGPGPGRMNKYTIQTVTQGLANYIRTFSKSEWQKGVVICHDSRNHSREFAEETARVLAGNKIPVHLVRELRPTPFASFCVRYYGAIAGINITASHNPKEYNGYKVYWHDGGQVVSPHDTGIIKEIEKVSDLSSVELAELSDPLITLIDEKADTAYLDAIYNLTLQKETNQKEGKSLSIVYSPLNGAGITMIPKALEKCGFSHVKLVDAQKTPDGNFPTTPYPNPETDAALALGWKDLIQTKADILLVSDPDSDRISCSIIVDGKPKRLTGNEMGIIMLDYLIRTLAPKGKWAVVTTIVSSELIKRITEKHGGTCFEVLTGFKYIGEKIHEWEMQKESYEFLFGMEESLGYLYGTHARDKDATIAAVLIAEIALQLKRQNKTLLDGLEAIYKAYGVYREDQIVISLEEGVGKSLRVMNEIRKAPPKELLGQPVVLIEDYQSLESRNCLTNTTKRISLPKSNVITFYLQDKSRFILRPSGTEPKMKIYGSVTKPLTASLQEEMITLDKKLTSMLAALKSLYFS